MSSPWILKLLLRKASTHSSWADRLMLGILAGGLVLLIGLFASLLWFSYSNRSVTTLLPAGKTVAYAELEDLTLPPRLGQKNLLDLLGLSAAIKTAFGLEAADLLSALSQGRVGLALLDDGSGQNKPLLFMRATRRGKALAFFQKLLASGETLTLIGDKKQPIYTFPQSQAFSFCFVGPTLLIAKNTATLQLVLDSAKDKTSTLDSDKGFQASQANLPRSAWGRGYINLKSLTLGTDTLAGQTVAPLKSLLDHFAFTLRKEQNGFHLNTFLALQPDSLSLQGDTSDSTRFTRTLADDLGSKNLALYLGGANLSREWQNTLETLGKLNPSYGVILEGIARAQVNKTFGDGVSLANDLYPLLEGEYALALEKLEDGSLGIKLLLRHTDRSFAEVKLQKLTEGFRHLAAQFSPTIKVVTLPDGTESKELVADTSRLKSSKETYRDRSIDCIDIVDSPLGFCTTVTDDLAIMANHPESIKETLDLLESPKFVLSQSQLFRQSLSNLSAISDEVTFIDLKNALPLTETAAYGPLLSNLLEPFSAMTWVKHYFDDGVSTEGYLLLK